MVGTCVALTTGGSVGTRIECIDDVEPQAAGVGAADSTADLLRKRLAEELEAARVRPDGTKLRQEDLAQIMGRDQTTVSRYVRGLSLPDLEALRKYEEFVGLPRGTFASRAGYVVPAVTVADAIEAAPELADVDRRSLLKAYRGAVDHSRERGSGAPLTNDCADDSEVGL